MSVERLPPQDIEAEQSVLGSLLIDPEAIIKVAPFLRAGHFYREAHAQIYQAILALHERGEPADFITVCSELERREGLEPVGGAAYLTLLINIPPTSAHVESYAHIVEQMATYRRLIAAAGQIAALAYQQPENVEDTLDRAEQIIFRVSQERITRDLIPLKDVLQEYYERIGLIREEGGRLTGVPSGFEDLDKMVGGFQPSDLVIVAGRPGAGKSSLVLTVARNIAVRFGGSVAIFSLEMSRDQVAQRLLASESGIDSQRLRVVSLSDGEFTRLVQTIDLLSEAPIFIDDTPIPTPLEISAKARRLHAERALAAVIVDYLQLMRAGERVENRVQEVSLISRRLKALARELNVPVIVCSQLSRAVESRPDKRPILSDLRESGSIEQDADVVIFIYRDEMYNPNTDRPNIADIILAKHRHGPTGQIYLHFDRSQVRFRSLEVYREEEEELVF